MTREPWSAREGCRASATELDTALYVAADAVRVVAELLRPFMPGTGERTLRDARASRRRRTRGRSLGRGELQRRHAASGDTTPLFPRIEHSVEELRTHGIDPIEASTTVSPGPPAPAAPAPPHRRGRRSRRGAGRRADAIAHRASTTS